MSKIRRGNYVFLTWTGDHSPRHVHVYRNGRLVLKWDHDHRKAMKGKPSRKVLVPIQELERQGLL